MTAAILLVAAGLAMLIAGAEVLVRGAAALAAALGVPPVVVGLTVVSVGTSASEVAIGIDSASNDAGPLAIGNIAGTNIVNLLLILGLPAAIATLAIAVPTIRRGLPFRGDRDLAIGSLIGSSSSSTYNIGLVLGGSALVAPLAVPPNSPASTYR